MPFKTLGNILPATWLLWISYIGSDVHAVCSGRSEKTTISPSRDAVQNHTLEGHIIKLWPTTVPTPAITNAFWSVDVCPTRYQTLAGSWWMKIGLRNRKIFDKRIVTNIMIWEENIINRKIPTQTPVWVPRVGMSVANPNLVSIAASAQNFVTIPS